jgi:microsomal dipeptidase-like Zn-dependent dipeptidase
MYFANEYIDFHCHPALKPYGKSFRRTPTGIQSPHRSNKTSFWYYDPPDLADRLLNYAARLTKFSQANGQSLARGGVRVICASLYPLEKGFVNNEIKSDILSDFLVDLATGLGLPRIDFLREMPDYYGDLVMEYDFYRQQHNRIVNLPEGRFRYQLVRDYSDIEASRNPDPDGVQTICVVLSIEGLHVLNTGLGRTPEPEAVLSRLQEIKNWEFAPFFITVAHHFWNHLCGHAPSFSGIVGRSTDQREGMDTGLTPLGIEVLRAMLSDSGGAVLLPDLKHMSARARAEFYALRENGALGAVDFPILFSHAACNGLNSFGDPTPGRGPTATLMNPVSINVYDDEIIRIARSNGIIGLQLDERRIASSRALKDLRRSLYRNKIMHYRSELLWRQIRHIAETLDQAGLFAWDCMAIGSDFDGIIDSLNGFWTAEELPYLADFTERHAYNYLKSAHWNVPENAIRADEAIRRVFGENGHRFLKENFIRRGEIPK